MTNMTEAAKNLAFQKRFSALMEDGPSRVLITAEGHSVPAHKAREQHGVVPDIIFIRRDDWSLGVPAHWESIAYNMWKNEWVAFLRRPSLQVQPIALYKLPEEV